MVSVDEQELYCGDGSVQKDLLKPATKIVEAISQKRVKQPLIMVQKCSKSGDTIENNDDIDINAPSAAAAKNNRNDQTQKNNSRTKWQQAPNSGNNMNMDNYNRMRVSRNNATRGVLTTGAFRSQ